MASIFSFPPIAAPDAAFLILGSMPGAASLAARQYYAHPHNRFWPILGALIGAAPALPYTQRLALLKKRGIALWDVLQHCEREGSLDSAIRNEVPNDFEAFFRAHPRIAFVAFNGQKADRSFRRQVLPALSRFSLPTVVLPSTSAAYAGMSFASKLEAWRAVFDRLGVRRSEDP